MGARDGFGEGCAFRRESVADVSGSTQFDVVIVGAGIVGTSIAYSLIRKGVRDIAIVEMKHPSWGSTGKAAGLVTHQLWNPLDIELVKMSLQDFRKASEHSTSADLLRPLGMVTLAEADEDKRALSQIIRSVRAAGIGIEELDADAVKEIYPGIAVSKDCGGSLCRSDAYVDPTGYVAAICQRAQADGAQVFVREEVVDIETSKGSVRGVRTRRRHYKTRKAVVAAGVWSRHIVQMSGVDLPLKPYRTQALLLNAAWMNERPMLHDPGQQLYLRPDTPTRILVGDGTELVESDPTAFDEQPSWQFQEEVSRKLTHRFLAAKTAQVSGGWAGLCSSTPDRFPLLGQYQLEGLYVACGFQGTGIMRGPAIGRITADLILGEKPAIDVRSYLAERFAGFIEFKIREGFTLR